MDIQRGVQELLDRQAIADVIYAYCFHFDQNEPERVAELFTARGTVDDGPEAATIVGGDSIAATIATGLERTFAATSHHVSNIQLTFEDDDTARGITYLYAWHRYVDGSPDGELWGRYHHRFERTEAGWKIAELVLTAAGAVDFHRSTMHPTGRR
jgi:ketosteroid isomerase-like protein